jgi:hypothetical protein
MNDNIQEILIDVRQGSIDTDQALDLIQEQLRLAVETEREACADVCEDQCAGIYEVELTDRCAQAIRARGQA